MGIIFLFQLPSLKPANFIHVFKESETRDSHRALAEEARGPWFRAHLKAPEISHIG